MATMFGFPIGSMIDDTLSQKLRVMSTEFISWRQQRLYAVLASPNVYLCILTLMMSQILLVGFDSTSALLVLFALCLLVEFLARMFVNGCGGCAQISYGKLDMAFVLIFVLIIIIRACLPKTANMPIAQFFISSGRIFRIEFIVWSALRLLPRLGRKVAFFFTVFPIVHFAMCEYIVTLSPEEHHVPEHFRHAGNAMIHLNPFKKEIYTDLFGNYQGLVIFILWYWIILFGRAIICSVKEYRNVVSAEQDKAITEALLTCELQIHDPVPARHQDFENVQREAKKNYDENIGPDKWAQSQESTRKCFVPNTMFWTSPSTAKKAEAIEEGDKVLSLSGTQLRVEFAQVHPPQLRELMELRTRAAYLKVTGDHLITVPDVDGKPFLKKQAKDLRIGDDVFVGARIAPLVKTRISSMRVEVIELHFEPNEPVESFLSPQWGVLSWGQGIDEELENLPSTDDGI